MQVPNPKDHRLFDKIIEESPTTPEEIERLEVYKILLIVGVYIALGIGILHENQGEGFPPSGGGR